MNDKNKLDISIIWKRFGGQLAAILTLCYIALFPAISQAQSIDVRDLYHEDYYTGFSLSPSGNLIAIGDRRKKGNALIQVVDLRTDEVVGNISAGDNELLWVEWATENRLLLSFMMKQDIKLPSNYYTRDEDGKRSRYFRDIKFARMMAVDVDGSNAQIMMPDVKLDWNGDFRLDRVTSVLPSDPDHILVPAYDRGLNLYKVNIHDGSYEKVQDGKDNTFAFDVDRNGFAFARYDASSRGKYVRVYVRAVGEKKWSKLATVREEDLETFSPVAGSETPGQIFVSATPDGTDRAAIYRYDLASKTFMEKVADHPRVDVKSVLTDFDNNYIGTAFTEHRLTYKFEDPDMNEHLSAINAALSNKMNVTLLEVSKKDGYWLVLNSGPEDPGTINIYNPKTAKLDKFISLNSRINMNNLSPMEVINYTASDGQALSGYLTTPKHGRADVDTPLVVLVHGGPEARDYYAYEEWSQYLASNGFAVFQPQFRGSSGFGKAFAAAGYGEWGGRMQDDVTDGVEHLIKTGQATRGKICIVGSSYGGYAALMGAVKTPELYQCASSINGVTDLLTQAEYDKDYFGKKSETWEYVKKTMGDPKKDRARMIATSPARQAKHIQIPIQLIHGSNDEVVSIEQSEYMRDALIAVKNPAEYIRMEGVRHNLRGGKSRYYGRRTALENLRKFLYTHLQSEDDFKLETTNSAGFVSP